MLKLNVNGRARTVDVEPEMPLLWVLRDQLGLPGAKYGCGIAVCGACTVMIDGRTARSCLHFAIAVQGCEIATVESLGFDGATGWGLLQCAEVAVQFARLKLGGARVAVQGFGNVGSVTALAVI